MSKCDRCGVEMERIQYIYPLPKGISHDEGALMNRPPLCESCWNIAYEERYGHKYEVRP